MKRSIIKSVIAIVMLLSTVSFGSPNLSGQYWFGSLSVDADGSAPWGKRGTVSITGNQWDQEWEDYNGHHTFSSAFTTATQPDGSINVNFPVETFPAEIYNVAWNGDVMIHAGSVLGGGGEGIDIFTRKATNVDVNDVLGDYSFFGHYLGRKDDTAVWGNFTFDPNGTFTPTWTNDHGRFESDGLLNWTLDDVNAVIEARVPMGDDLGLAKLFLGKGDIGSTYHIVLEEGRDGNDLGYNIFIKKTDQVITMADIAGTYQIRFLETGPGGVPYTCGQGTCVIEAVDDTNGILSLDAYFSDGTHDMNRIDCSVGPGNEFHLDDNSVPDGIISPDKNLIVIPEYRYENPPTRTPDDWIGGIFLIRMPNNIADLNGDGIVDSADMCIMIDHWGTDNQLCDIAPMPWGDGVVDVQDLIVLAEHLFEVYPSAETVEVNEDNDGRQIELELGEILVVTLESNPSTGYRWELLEDNESILKQFGQAEFKSSETSDPPMVGVGGWEIFRFKAVSTGQITLELVYHRYWEDVEPLKTFSLQVTVN